METKFQRLLDRMVDVKSGGDLLKLMPGQVVFVDKFGFMTYIRTVGGKMEFGSLNKQLGRIELARFDRREAHFEGRLLSFKDCESSSIPYISSGLEDYQGKVQITIEGAFK